MMKSVVLTLAALVVAEARIIMLPRQAPGPDTCCFGLESVGIIDEEVNESHVGSLSLGGPFQNTGFCLNKATRKMQDTLNHGCFMRDPDQQFRCYAGLAGETNFDIVPAGSSGRLYLKYDNGPGKFWACPVGTGADVYYNIFSSSKDDTEGCETIALSLYNTSPACSAYPTNPPNATVSTRDPGATKGRTSRGHQLTVNTPRGPPLPSYEGVPGAPLWLDTGSRSTVYPRAAPPPSPKVSQSCSVAPSAPSIAPMKLGPADKSVEDGVRDSHGEASITSDNSTVFSFSIPTSFPPQLPSGEPPLCALQFRMPVCSELPKGYPCYHFSGLEQEFLSNSGMNFDLILDDGQAAWNKTELHQVSPGKSTIVGVFECGAPKGAYEARKMSWNVSSVRNFGLEFLQAGVGNDTEYQDGVGVWIVHCQ
ncbi:hypothetical protein GGS20DRAFT_431556 [Poronia punctata]|nr:hypothetical protein GGS20DRAFT_431556 [Poronia punctata]